MHWITFYANTTLARRSDRKSPFFGQ